ncbi:unnamed protein product [Closterium sp. NIES-54]
MVSFPGPDVPIERDADSARRPRCLSPTAAAAAEGGGCVGVVGVVLRGGVHSSSLPCRCGDSRSNSSGLSSSSGSGSSTGGRSCSSGGFSCSACSNLHSGALTDSGNTHTGASEVLSVGALATARLVPAFVAGSGAISPTAQLSFTLDSGASNCFFRDCTNLTPLQTPVTVSLADPSVGSVVAESTTTLPCPAAPSGFLTGYYTPSFSRNLVGVSHLQDLGVVTNFPLHEPVASCTVDATGAPLATFHREPGSGLPESLAPLPRSPALPCTPCVEGRQRAAPHFSSFAPTTAPLQTLHLDVWGSSPVLGSRQERYFLIVVDDYSRYTTVFPLRRKADVPTVLEPWLLARGGVQGQCGLRLHSDRGGEFSSTRLETFCQGRGIIQSYTLPHSPQQNRVAERRIGLVMEVARTSMRHADAPQFLWPQADRYAAHQLSLWPSDAQPQVTPIFLRTGWVFYDPVTHQFFASQDVTFEELFSYYRSRPHQGFEAFPPPLFLTLEPPPVAPIAPPPSRPAPSSVSHVTPQSFPPHRLVPVVSGGAGGAVAEGEGTWAAGACRASSGGVEGVRVETTLEEDTIVSTQRPRPASPPGFPSVPQFPPSSPPRPVAAEPGGVPAGGNGVPWGVVSGGSGSGGAGARDTSTATPTLRTIPAAVLVGASRESRGGVATAAAAVSVRASGESRGVAAAAAAAVSVGASGENRGGVMAAAAAVSVGASGESRGGFAVAAKAAEVSVGASGEGRGGVTAATAAAAAVSVGVSRESRGGVTAAAAAATTPAAAAAAAAAAPAALPLGATGGSRGGVTSAAGAGTVAADARGGGAAATATARPARPSTCTLISWSSTVPSCSPRPVPTAPLSSVSALVTTVAGFAASHCLDYAAHLVSGPAHSPSSGGAPVFPLEVLEDRQFELGFLAAAVPHLCAMLLAPKGDPDALDIPIPRTHVEAVSGPWASYWIAAEEAEMASYRSTGTYVDAVPPPGANVVSGMWLYKVKRPPGAPPVFKVRYVVRGFSQREGVDFFQIFAPTPKMTTLWVLLHIAAQRDYELHSLDFSTAFLQGSLHKHIWLRRPPGFTSTFPPGTQWQLRRPVYGLRRAPREWHDTLRTTLAALDFFPSSADPSLFVRRGSTPFFVLVYVDDLVFATPDQHALASVKEELQRRHTCTDLGEL